MIFATLFSFAAVLTVASGEVLSLTSANYVEETAGKTVFIKFFAPWCGHCKSMAPDWEKLAKEWSGHKVGLIAEVDCTIDDGQKLCEDNNVEGFPTLMHGDPSSLEAYEGGRDYDSLAAFAKDNISKPVCSLSNLDICSDEDKATIAELKKKTTAELEAVESTVSEQLETAQTDYDAAVEQLQADYEKMTADFNAKLDTIRKESNYKWVQQLLVKTSDSSGVGEEL